MENAQLEDARYFGNRFTWTNGHMWKRLDRALVTHNWADKMNSTKVFHLLRRTSDHCPLLLEADRNQFRGYPNFRILKMWLDHKDFENIVKRSWQVTTGFSGMMNLKLKF